MENLTTEKVNKAIGRAIRLAREKKGYTQPKLAELVGINDEKYFSKVESGTRGLVGHKLMKTINILQITPNVIYGEMIDDPDLLKQMEVSKEINEMPPERIDELLDIIEVMKRRS